MDAVLEFWVITGNSTKEKAVTLDLNDIYGQFHIDIKAMNITIAATKASVKSMSIPQDTIGNLTDAISQIESLVGQVLTQALPPINAALAKSPIQVPNKIFGLFELSDLTLKNHNGYIEAGLTPKFIPPTEAIFVQPESIFTKPGTYRYVQTLDGDDNFTMWDTKLNQIVEDVKSVNDLD